MLDTHYKHAISDLALPLVTLFSCTYTVPSQEVALYCTQCTVYDDLVPYEKVVLNVLSCTLWGYLKVVLSCTLWCNLKVILSCTLWCYLKVVLSCTLWCYLKVVLSCTLWCYLKVVLSCTLWCYLKVELTCTLWCYLKDILSCTLWCYMKVLLSCSLWCYATWRLYSPASSEPSTLYLGKPGRSRSNPKTQKVF